jgi:DNA-binding GntR family transcriptional regulator
MEALVDAPSLRDQVYDILKNMIILREIQPGQKVPEEELCRKLGVSRTPIRETLCRLENEGIVRIVPRRGAFVVVQSKQTVREILEIREALEGLVARLATQNMDAPTAERIMKSLARADRLAAAEPQPAKYTHADIEFHELLLKACDNQMLHNMMQVVNAHLQIIRLRTVVLPGRARKTVKEHFKIMEAVNRRDPDQAEDLMRQHIRSVRRVALDNIDAMV